MTKNNIENLLDQLSEEVSVAQHCVNKQKEIIHGEERKFKVHIWSIVDADSPKYVHWSEGLKMRIEKDGVSITLNSEEIEQLVKSLPQTVGGTY